MTNREPLPKYTSFGSYPLFYFSPKEAECLCQSCAEEERDELPDLAEQVNWEDPDLYCDACSCRIESAYAEPETQAEVAG
jgi:hypothetical protein